MNSKMLFMAFAMLLTMTLQASKATAEVTPPVNFDDPKMDQDARRLANPQLTQAEALVKGVPCETGACFKDAHPTLGFEPEVLIEPSGTAGAPLKTKDGAITK